MDCVKAPVSHDHGMQIVSNGSWRNAPQSPGVLLDGGDAPDSEHRDRYNDCDPRQSFSGHEVISFSRHKPPYLGQPEKSIDSTEKRKGCKVEQQPGASHHSRL